MSIALMGPSGGARKLNRVRVGAFSVYNYTNESIFPFNATSIPNYKKLTVENFAPYVTSYSAAQDCNGVGERKVTISYNPETGTGKVVVDKNYGYKMAGCHGIIYCYYVG